MALNTLVKYTQNITHSIGAYTTETDLFTVASGHMYLIKRLIISGKLESTGSSGTGAMRFKISDQDATDFIYLPDVALASAAYNAATRFILDFAIPKADIITAFPASIPSSSSIYTPGIYQDSLLYNKLFQAGQKLTFSPLDDAGAGWNNTTMSHNIDIHAEYLDMTL